jgi:hypothetical protein
MKNRVSSAVEKRGKLCEENDWPLREKTGIAVNDPGHFFRTRRGEIPPGFLSSRPWAILIKPA